MGYPQPTILEAFSPSAYKFFGAPTLTFRQSFFFILPLVALCSAAQTSRWSEQKANDWYAQQPWLVGSNYIPKSAINELEMWQQDPLDPPQITHKLGWA